MLRNTSIALNILVIIVSASFFAYTFFAKEHLTHHAREFVTEKTLAYSRPAVEMIEQGMDSPIASKLIFAEKKEAVESELAKYRENPLAYIASATNDRRAKSLATKPSKLDLLKHKISEHYHSTLKELITDLRIFSGSNVVAGLLALVLLFKVKAGNIRQIELFSLFIFASVTISTYTYLDGISFFNILFKWHLGWAYPIGIATTAIYFYKEYGDLARKKS